jgi:hypothetical protein
MGRVDISLIRINSALDPLSRRSRSWVEMVVVAVQTVESGAANRKMERNASLHGRILEVWGEVGI